MSSKKWSLEFSCTDLKLTLNECRQRVWKNSRRTETRTDDLLLIFSREEAAYRTRVLEGLSVNGRVEWPLKRDAGSKVQEAAFVFSACPEVVWGYPLTTKGYNTKKDALSCNVKWWNGMIPRSGVLEPLLRTRGLLCITDGFLLIVYVIKSNVRSSWRELARSSSVTWAIWNRSHRF